MSLVEYPILTDEEKASMIESSTHSESYNILGNRVRILGNAPAPIDSFTSMYESFVTRDEGSSEADIRIHFRCDASSEGDVLTFLSGDKAYLVRDPEIVKWSFGILTYLVLHRIRSHFLIHAGCVSRDGQGIIIAGDSGMGKSTLTSHLVSRGMGFLTDEIASISRETGFVDPFPRRVCIRPGPGEQLLDDDMETIACAMRDDARLLVNPRDLPGARIAEGVPLHAVIFLSTSPRSQVSTAMKFENDLLVTVTGHAEGFDKEIVALPGVTVKERRPDLEFPEYLLDVEEPEGILQKVQSLCQKHGIELAGFRFEDLDGPDFDRSPELVRIPAAAGIIELIKKIPAACKNETIQQEFDGKMSLFIEELASLVKDVAFYKLSPGHLEEMLATVQGLP